MESQTAELLLEAARQLHRSDESPQAFIQTLNRHFGAEPEATELLRNLLWLIRLYELVYLLDDSGTPIEVERIRESIKS